jgi:hypothetical protein
VKLRGRRGRVVLGHLQLTAPNQRRDPTQLAPEIGADFRSGSKALQKVKFATCRAFGDGARRIRTADLLGAIYAAGYTFACKSRMTSGFSRRSLTGFGGRYAGICGDYRGVQAETAISA